MIIGQLISFLAFLLSILATFGAVFLGVYLNGVIDRERERENEIFRPLVNETREVREGSAHQPIRTLITNGNHQSVSFDFQSMDLYSVDKITQSAILSYRDEVKHLAKLNDTSLSASELLHESGYGEFLREQLPEEMLIESDKGIGSKEGKSAIGPYIVAGRRTVISGRNSVIPSNSTRIHGDERLPLLPLLVENAPLLRQADSTSEFRSIIDSQTDVDVDHLGERCPNWDDALWKTLEKRWQGDEIDYENGLFGHDVISEGQYQNMVAGENFREVLSSAGTALELRRLKQRERVIDLAEKLHARLLIRLSRPLYHPKRILLARQ